MDKKEILELYREHAEKRALPTDQSAYADVARILKRMRSFEGGNAMVDQLLEKYRTTYKRRKNMIAELRNV